MQKHAKEAKEQQIYKKQKMMKYEFPVVCVTISGNFQGKIDPRGIVYNSRHIPGSFVHWKTAVDKDFLLFRLDFG